MSAFSLAPWAPAKLQAVASNLASGFRARHTNSRAGGSIPQPFKQCGVAIIRSKLGSRRAIEVEFRFGKSASFLGVERDAWRWAWQILSPPLMHLDLDLVRRVLTDHLADHVLTVDDRAGVPFLFDAVTGNPGSYRNWARYRDSFPVPPARPPNTPVTAHELSPEKSAELAAWARTVGIDVDPKANELEQWPKVIMGFVSKGIEVADSLLIEARPRSDFARSAHAQGRTGDHRDLHSPGAHVASRRRGL